MRKIIFGVANSLDNFIAREDGSVDWLLDSDEVTRLMNEFWPTIDTVIMGRKSYEVSLEFEGAGEYPVPIKTYVFSSTLKAQPGESVEIVSEDAIEFVRNLKEQDGKDICCMGGGEFARSLFEAGLIDEVALNIHPVILGSGVPLFLDLAESIDLELVECQTIEHGCVLLTYRVVH